MSEILLKEKQYRVNTGSDFENIKIQLFQRDRGLFGRRSPFLIRYPEDGVIMKEEGYDKPEEAQKRFTKLCAFHYFWYKKDFRKQAIHNTEGFEYEYFGLYEIFLISFDTETEKYECIIRYKSGSANFFSKYLDETFGLKFSPKDVLSLNWVVTNDSVVLYKNCYSDKGKYVKGDFVLQHPNPYEVKELFYEEFMYSSYQACL